MTTFEVIKDNHYISFNDVIVICHGHMFSIMSMSGEPHRSGMVWTRGCRSVVTVRCTIGSRKFAVADLLEVVG